MQCSNWDSSWWNNWSTCWCHPTWWQISMDNIWVFGFLHLDGKLMVFGLRIKTWPTTPITYDLVSNLHFENIIMDNVSNPVIIDQEYCSWNQCSKKVYISIQNNFHLSKFKSFYLFGTCISTNSSLFDILFYFIITISFENKDK